MNAALACAQANRGQIARVFGRGLHGEVGDYIEGRIFAEHDLIRVVVPDGDDWIVPPAAVAGIIVAEPAKRAAYVAASFQKEQTP